jgi:osmotically-inducible protein OsmY
MSTTTLPDVGLYALTDIRRTVTYSDLEPTLSNNRSDSEIAEEIRNALKWHIPLPETLTALIEKGRVTLKGETTWEYERKSIDDIVRHLRGVKAVTNLIVIKPIAKPLDRQDRRVKISGSNARIDYSLNGKK